MRAVEPHRNLAFPSSFDMRARLARPSEELTLPWAPLFRCFQSLVSCAVGVGSRRMPRNCALVCSAPWMAGSMMVGLNAAALPLGENGASSVLDLRR